MNIICDFHHADLWWSVQLLSDRLGAKLYRPYGMEWYDEGYYKLYGDLRRKDPERWIAKQYLEDTIFSGLSRETYEGCEDYPKLNLLTLEEAKHADIDVVICSVNENESYFLKLKEFYPNAKFIRQIGNDLDVNTVYPNLLASAKIPYDAFTGHKVLYRQEFDVKMYRNHPPRYLNNIYSFQNNIQQFEDTWNLWIDLKHKLPEYNFKSFGAECDNGKIFPKKEYIDKMSEATFVLQSKDQWEGYGHTIHNVLCLGRPMIIKFSDYKGKLAEPLLIKDQTYLEMDNELPEKIKYYSYPDRLQKMSEKCRKVFSDNVNFDVEFELNIKPFFDNLV